MVMKKHKKLGYIVSMFPRLSETFIINEILELENLGFDLVVFSRKPAEGSPFHPVHVDFLNIKSPALLLGVRRFRDWLPMLKDHVLCLILKPRGYIRAFHQALKKKKRTVWVKFLVAGRVSRQVMKRNIEHLHAHFADNAKIANFSAVITGREFSFTAHAKDIWVKSTPSALRKAVKASRFAVTICRYNQEYLSQISSRPERIHLIYNGLDCSKFSSSARNTAAARNGYEILAVGRLVPKKGFQVLVEACRILAGKELEFICRLVGDGELLSDLEILIQKYGLQDVCRLEGICSQEDLIQRYLSQADILVAPSVVASNGDRDGIPTVILEALAMEIPVIASPVAGIPEIVINGRTGILVPPHSHEDLAAAMTSLLTDREFALSLGKEGAALIRQKFDRARNVKNLALLLDGRRA